jgi:vacuolar protein sorting-associated protein 54
MAVSGLSSHRRPTITKVNEVVKSTEKWDVYASGRQNLAAALNNPQNRELDLFTKMWGEAFVPTAPLPASTIPRVTKEHFKEYLKLTRKGRKVHAKIDRELNTTCLESPKETKFISNDVTVVEQDGREYDLTAVPRIYFHSSFALENSSTFEEILPIENVLGLGEKESGEGVRQHRMPPTDKLLHEKLTHYLDLVEVHLAYQIAQRADTFFASISSHDLLKDEIKKLLFDLSQSRSHLKRSDETVATDHIHLLHYSAKRYRCQLVYNKLKVLWAVQQTPPTIKLLLSTSDFIGALDLIASTKDALQTELVGIHCVRHLYSELHELEKAIEKMMEDDFASLVLEFIKELLANRSRRGSSDGEVTALEERLEAVVIGLIRQRKLHFLSALRDILLPWTKSLVRETARRQLRMREVDSPMESEESVKMGDLVRGQEFRSWLDLLEAVFARMIDCLQATKRALNLLMKVIKSECVDPTGDGNVSSGSDLANSPSVATSMGFISDPSVASQDDNQSLHSDTIGVDYESVARKLEADERMDQLLMEDELSSALVSGSVPMVTVGVTTRQESTDVDKFTNRSISRSSEVSRSSSLSEVNGKISLTDCRRLVSECHELLCTVADFAHGRCTKLLGFRAKAGKLENLHSNEFTSLVRLIEKFVSNTADITGRQCPSLRAPLLSHSKKFLEQFHESRKSKLGLLMESERWKQCDVPPEIQDIVIAIETCKNKSLEVKPSSSTQQSKDYLMVKGQNFAVVGVVLLLVKVMMEYCQCASDLPTLAYDVMGKLVDVMKVRKCICTIHIMNTCVVCTYVCTYVRM